MSQINDLLDYARMEHTRLTLHPASTSLHSLLTRLKDNANLLASERGNRFVLELAPALPIWVVVDANRLVQILMVLINIGSEQCFRSVMPPSPRLWLSCVLSRCPVLCPLVASAPVSGGFCKRLCYHSNRDQDKCAISVFSAVC